MSTSQQTFNPTVGLEFLDNGQIAILTLTDKARARFQITFTNLGFYPGMALSYLLPRAVNRQQSNLMMLAARPFSGREAAEAGFVARSVPPGRLMTETMALAREIASNEPKTTQALTKALRIKREELKAPLEADGRRQAESYGTQEFRDRIAAYLPDHYSPA
jgi:enoyl-CoA hydratase/carnithine racemase